MIFPFPAMCITKLKTISQAPAPSTLQYKVNGSPCFLLQEKKKHEMSFVKIGVNFN